jgi:DNA mismatch repair protein MutS
MAMTPRSTSCALSGDARRAIAAMEARYRDETGIAALKIRHNGVLGYFIEVPARHADALMAPDSGFTHRQTMAGAVRFNSLTLHEEAAGSPKRAAMRSPAEEAHFEELVAAVIAAREAIAAPPPRSPGSTSPRANAERAAEGDWCRPRSSRTRCLAITGGRHPVVEAALARAGERFVANDCRWRDNRLWLIGGPNMGGKSTFLRQNALIVLLAQAGASCPHRGADRPGRPPVQPGRRGGQSGAGALDLHGRDGRNRRDPRAGDRAAAS